MAQDSPDSERIEAARRPYIKYQGKHLDLLEQEMRELGYAKFHRRILHPRFERGHHRPGWIERLGFAERSPTAETQSKFKQAGQDKQDNKAEKHHSNF